MQKNHPVNVIRHHHEIIQCPPTVGRCGQRFARPATPSVPRRSLPHSGVVGTTLAEQLHNRPCATMVTKYIARTASTVRIPDRRLERRLAGLPWFVAPIELRGKGRTTRVAPYGVSWDLSLGATLLAYDTVHVTAGSSIYVPSSRNCAICQLHNHFQSTALGVRQSHLSFRMHNTTCPCYCYDASTREYALALESNSTILGRYPASEIGSY